FRVMVKTVYFWSSDRHKAYCFLKGIKRERTLDKMLYAQGLLIRSFNDRPIRQYLKFILDFVRQEMTCDMLTPWPTRTCKLRDSSFLLSQHEPVLNRLFSTENLPLFEVDCCNTQQIASYLRLC